MERSNTGYLSDKYIVSINTNMPINQLCKNSVDNIHWFIKMKV